MRAEHYREARRAAHAVMEWAATHRCAIEVLEADEMLEFDFEPPLEWQELLTDPVMDLIRAWFVCADRRWPEVNKHATSFLRTGYALLVARAFRADLWRQVWPRVTNPSETANSRLLREVSEIDDLCLDIARVSARIPVP